MRTRNARRVGYTVSIALNIILLAFIHGVLNWRLPFVTDQFVAVRWTLDLSVGATIIANALYYAYDPAWFRDLIQIILSALALLVIVVFYRRFPFDFGDPAANDVGHLLIGLLLFALVVAILAQTIAWLADISRRSLHGAHAEVEAAAGHQRSSD